ncbi:hypothetical protein EI94DRAFT_138204 [Lactarius quietus]|nr:hypothetical protein EI94DRAFT_138204 [Lactarius quietus]
MTSHYNTFRDQLAIAHPTFGYALWEPVEQGQPEEQYPPVDVGDVGYVDKGNFTRLFNALLPGDHPSHQRFGVPDGYEPLGLSTPNHINRGPLYPGNFCSCGVTLESGGSEYFPTPPGPNSDPVEVAFLCTKKQGAALSLPVAALREDTVSRAHFGKWMTRHIESWFAFSQRHGMEIEMEDIVLVTGFHRTTSRSNDVFNDGQNSRVSLRVQTPGNGTTVHWQVLGQRHHGAMLSSGPSWETLAQNQCLFIRGFRVKRFLWVLPRLGGAAEPKPDPRGDDREPRWN